MFVKINHKPRQFEISSFKVLTHCRGVSGGWAWWATMCYITTCPPSVLVATYAPALNALYSIYYNSSHLKKIYVPIRSK